MNDGDPGIPCPACGEELPPGARFCGGCGRPLTGPSPGMVACPLCRTEVPEHARFCGACGQPLGPSASAFVDPSPSMPAGMVQVPLLHGLVATPESPEPEPAPAPAARTTARHGTLEDDTTETTMELVDEVEPTEPGRLPLFEEFAVHVDIDDEETTLQLTSADAIAAGGEYERAVHLLLESHGLRPGEPRVRERLASFGHALGRAVAERGRRGELSATALRAELRRLLHIAPDRGWQDALRQQIAPTATADDVGRIRGLLADGHVSAALSLSERVLAVGCSVPELRVVRHEAVVALVREVTKLQQAGDAALRRGDFAKAASWYEDALVLMEDDRVLLARLEQARRPRPAARERPTGRKN